MVRYFDAEHKALPAGATSAISLDCGTDQQLWNDSANPANLNWDGDTPSFKTEAERVAILIPGYKARLSQAVQSYIYQYYDAGEQNSMIVLDTKGNAAQIAACDDVWSWIYDDVQKGDYFTRVATLLAATTYAELEATDFDFSNNDATKPAYTYSDIVQLT